MNLYKMKKEELIARCKKLQSENENLQDELDRLSDCYTEMENQLADAQNVLDIVDSINDVEWFKYKLELDGLLTPELERFIDYYLKFYNKLGG